MLTLQPAPRVRLSNGLVIANFSSNHALAFTDGSVLPACDDERCQALSLEITETESPGIKGTTDLAISVRLTPAVVEALDVLEDDAEVDIVLCPRMVLEGIAVYDGNKPLDPDKLQEVARFLGPDLVGDNEDLGWKKPRSHRKANRVAGTICCDRFCK